MRRRIVALLCAAALTTLGGCAASLGVDNDLTDDWKLPAAPAGFTPEAKTCHAVVEEPATRASYEPVDCGKEHTSETVHVGQVSGENAKSTELPAENSWRDEDRECDVKADEFAGGPVRDGRLLVRLVPPSKQAWSGGSRWFRCELVEIDLDAGRPVTRTGSLAGSMAGAAPLKMRCFNPTIEGDDVTGMNPVDCGERHNSEFAGIYDAPEGEYDSLVASDERVRKACLSAIAKFTGAPDDNNMQYRTGYISLFPTEEDWKRRDRGIRCFIWNTKGVTRSLAGVGAKGLPINYG
jgi:hypothetical protein